MRYRDLNVTEVVTVAVVAIILAVLLVAWGCPRADGTEPAQNVGVGADRAVLVDRAWLDATLDELARAPSWRPHVAVIRRQLATYNPREPAW